MDGRWAMVRAGWRLAPFFPKVASTGFCVTWLKTSLSLGWKPHCRLDEHLRWGHVTPRRAPRRSGPKHCSTPPSGWSTAGSSRGSRRRPALRHRAFSLGSAGGSVRVILGRPCSRGGGALKPPSTAPWALGSDGGPRAGAAGGGARGGDLRPIGRNSCPLGGAGGGGAGGALTGASTNRRAYDISAWLRAMLAQAGWPGKGAGRPGKMGGAFLGG